MKKITYLFLLLIYLTSIYSSCKKDEYKDLDCSTINSSYSLSIKPIIDANCITSGCHDANSSNGNLTTYDGLLIRVNNGTLSEAVLYDKDMPKGGTLSLEDRQKIKCWIDGGAPKN